MGEAPIILPVLSGCQKSWDWRDYIDSERRRQGFGSGGALRYAIRRWADTYNTLCPKLSENDESIVRTENNSPLFFGGFNKKA